MKPYQTSAFPSIIPERTPSPPLCGGVGVNGFIDTPISLTEKFNPFTSAATAEDYFELRARLKLSKLRKNLRYEHSLNPSEFCEKYHHSIALENRPASTLFRINCFRSGETVGNTIVLGRKGKVPFSSRPGRITTTKLSTHANKVLRRSVECSSSALRFFVTLTFSPSHVPVESHRPDGTVCHKYAKDRLMRFLNTCKVNKYRQGKTLEYIWVSELQKNGNIHFHIMWNEFFAIKWLTKVWGQASNSVDIEKITDARHGCSYIRKYLAKQDEAPIDGNRYGVTSGLRESIKPVSYSVPLTEDSVLSVVRAVSDDIVQAGGYVHEFGFCVGASSRPKFYKDKNGQVKRTKGIPKWLGPSVVNILLGEVPF